MRERCKDVWLAVSGMVINEQGEWLIVKKKYGGLKGKWSFPAGFVKSDETVDEAVIREIKEETGIDIEVLGLIGVRSGVLSIGCSDNMLIFLCKPVSSEIVTQTEELYEARFMHPEQLMKDENRSVLLEQFRHFDTNDIKEVINGVNPGNHFGYLSYKLFV
ncbi:NUDIX domain-containing protein [Bacillus massiliigorillae]|uniref:NUDIX domain-containing protein n=1 Tax=Bacillus massiliigorillae TaxID=1243664 RepID=UPI0003A1F2E7|nr:NUDIX hydrolase [Bacillus massiliigorillae]